MKTLRKDHIFQPFISDNDFKSSNTDDDIGNNLCVFDVRCQKNLESAQPIKVEVNFSGNVPTGIYGYVLVLTSKLFSTSSDGQGILI